MYDTMGAKIIFIKYSRLLLLVVIFVVIENNLGAQITPNEVDIHGLKQGMWREFTIPISDVTEYVGFKVPKDSSEYIYLTQDRDRRYFPIVEEIGEYKDGLKTGVWLKYYGNGRIKSQVEYKNGVPIGNCKVFWGNGMLKKEFTISSDDSITVKAYEINGELLIEKIVPKTQVIKAIYEE